MATKRTPAKRRKKRKASRVPAIFLAGLIAGVGGVLFVRASSDAPDTSSPDTIGVDGSDAPSTDTAAPTDTGGSTETSLVPSTDPSNLGNPVTVFSDTLGDLSIDQVIGDWTPVDPPQLPGATAEVQASWVENGRITTNLPDGFYWGVPRSTFDEDERGINFDIRQAFYGDACIARFGTAVDACNNDYQVTPEGQQLYPSYLSDLLFVSMAVVEQPGTLNMAVVPATFWSLINGGRPATIDLPGDDTDRASAMLVGAPFLVTVVDGKIIAAEGIWVP